MRCCGGRLWRRCRYRSLTRRRCGCLGFACAGDQHHSKHRKHRSKDDRFFHSVNCFFTNDSSQIASPDVLKEKNSRTQPAVSRARNKKASTGRLSLHVDLSALFLQLRAFAFRFQNPSLESSGSRGFSPTRFFPCRDFMRAARRFSLFDRIE